jgi:hypothetical protein
MKQIFYFLTILFFSFSILSCHTFRKVSQSNEPEPEYNKPYREPDPILESLFDAKDRTISEENIRKLLDGKLLLPDTIRIAVYNYSKAPLNRYYYGNTTDEDYLKAQQSFVDTLVKTIYKSNKVKKVTLIPAMMITKSPNITTMRETAVRLQSDLLLVFSVTSDIYYKYRLFNKDEAKAYATAECMLMDVRTAMVPYSSIVTSDFFSKKSETDANLEELRKRAEKTAILQSLGESGTRLSLFFDGRN